MLLLMQVVDIETRVWITNPIHPFLHIVRFQKTSIPPPLKFKPGELLRTIQQLTIITGVFFFVKCRNAE